MQTSTDHLQDNQSVEQLIDSSFKSLSVAETASNAQVSTLAANVEKRLSTIRDLSYKRNDLQAQEQELKVQLEGLQVQDSLARQQRNQAQQAVNSANDALSRAHRLYEAAENDQKLGIGLMFVTIIGPIIGGLMIRKAREAMESAENMARSAELLYLKQVAAVTRYEAECQSYRLEIHSKNLKIADIAVNIQEIEQNLNWEDNLQQRLTNFLIPLRKCTTLLSTLAGKTRAANMLIELSGTLDELLPILEEIVVSVHPLVGSGTEYQLLISARLTTIIHKLEEANHRVKEAVASKQ
ncbi:uncharacterized protein [Pleurodeles waltl]|uniref:uncharacterized protein isoform X1 n=1 Tax=Pleurodeles waltl TaxID=8319 RepID=UPI003709AF5E